ncbi:phage baseplate plug family protein, partial [Ligilactobacillus equi]|uniref:phage baseplate plug family protein n=1 Tax=Ligilactobacillus equi TaxID=137357 RepID=UPI000468687A
MSNRRKYELDISQVPLKFETTFGNETFTIQLNYNSVGDFYTADLYNANNEPLILGEKLVYGKRLWSGYVMFELPAVDLIPLDESGLTNVCNKATFGGNSIS